MTSPGPARLDLSPRPDPSPRPGTTAEVVVVLGTRSEAVALAPVVRALRRCGHFSPLVVSTGQQRGVHDQVLRPLGVRPDVELAAPGADGTGSSRHLAAETVERLGELLATRRPHAVLVQGDSATAFAAALVAGSEGIGVGHLGAGVRAPRDGASPPAPREANQRLIAPLARWHLAPSRAAARNLVEEGVDPSAVTVTGATGVDTLLWAAALKRGASAFGPDGASRGGRILACLQLVGEDPDRSHALARSLNVLAADGLDVVLPLPPDGAPPSVVASFARDGVRLLPPLDYLDFVATLHAADLVVTDSGAVTEEAPAVGTPVVCVAPQAGDLVGACRSLVGRPDRAAGPTPSPGPFADGRATDRVLDVLTGSLSEPVPVRGAAKGGGRRLAAPEPGPPPRDAAPEGERHLTTVSNGGSGTRQGLARERPIPGTPFRGPGPQGRLTTGGPAFPETG